MLYLKKITRALLSSTCILMFVFLFSKVSSAQEFKCVVTINDDQLEAVSFEFIKELKPRIEEYINDFKWTETDYQEEERIKCQIQIIFEDANTTFDFSARTIFSLRRPIYDTTTETTTIILSDDLWQFNYPQGRTLIHDELQFDALTGFLDFYAYLMLGYDYDSFSLLGGTPFFENAQRVIDLAQTTSALGWTRTTNNRRNKVTMVDDLLNTGYEPFRTAYYEYHRLGLDTFIENEDLARENVLTVLRTLRDNKRRVTSNFLFDIFFDTKSREIAGILEGGSTEIKLEAYNILAETDQGHLSDYSGLQN